MERAKQFELMGECAIENGTTTAHVVEEQPFGTVDEVCKLRNLFHHVLTVFLDVFCKDMLRPLPVMFGDDQWEMDLFKLLWLVRIIGGYYAVPKYASWDFVAEECGLNCTMKAIVKLVYVKYLREFDRSLQGDFSKKDLMNEKLKSLLKELEFDLQRFIATNEDPTKKKMQIEGLKENGGGSHKKKQEPKSLSEMLNWVLKVAKQPTDPSVGRIPPPSNWKDCRIDELWQQALSVREALMIKGDICPNKEQSLLQKKLRTHPFMYEESAGHSHRIREKLQYNGRLPSLKICRFYPDCISCTYPQDKELKNISKVVACNKEKVENPKAVTSRKRKVKKIKDEKDSGNSDDMFSDNLLPKHLRRKHVNVGPLFQAEVPEWTGIITESDSRYLGITVCLPKNGDDSLNSMVSIGKGRDDESCNCLHPGSVTCTRFHIADKRFKLKLEIGSMFYDWRFDRMGEDISLSWTNKQEKRFKALIRLRNPSQKNSLWKNTTKFFPNKTRENLVSYYYNVFTLRRRRYQNRVTPQDIDSSDDEKKEFGDIDDHYGLDSLEFSGNNLPICVVNRECFDFK